MLTIAAGVLFWLFTALAFAALIRIESLQTEANRWLDFSGTIGWQWRLLMSFVLAGCLYVAQRTRSVSSYGAAAGIGLVLGIIGAIFNFWDAVSVGATQFMIWRSVLGIAGFVLPSWLILAGRANRMA